MDGAPAFHEATNLAMTPAKTEQTCLRNSPWRGDTISSEGCPNRLFQLGPRKHAWSRDFAR